MPIAAGHRPSGCGPGHGHGLGTALSVPILLALAGCGGEAATGWPVDDPPAGVLRGDFTAYVGDAIHPRIGAFHLYWRGVDDAGDEQPFATIDEGSWPEPTIYTIAFETRPPADTVALEIEVLVDWPPSPVLSARLPLLGADRAAIDRLDLRLFLGAARDDAFDEPLELEITAEIHRPADPGVVLLPSRTPRAGSHQYAELVIFNGLDRPIWPQHPGHLWVRGADGVLVPARHGVTCGGVVVIGAPPPPGLTPGAQQEMGEPFYIGGVNPLAPGEYLYRTAYRLAPVAEVCDGPACVRRDELYQVSLPLDIE